MPEQNPNASGTETAGLDLLWGAAAIGRAIGKTTRATYHLLENGHLPAVKRGDQWVVSTRKLREHFEGANA